MGDMRIVYTILIDKPEHKRPLGRPRRRWENNIRLHRKEKDWEGVCRMYVAQYRDQWQAFVNTVMNF